MKRMLYGFAALLVLLIVGAGIFIMNLDTIALQTRIEQAVSEQTGKALRLASAPRLSVFPLGVTCETVSWGEEKDDFSFSAQSGGVQLAFWPLLQKQIVIKNIWLDAPLVRVNEGVAVRTAEKTSPPAVSTARSPDEDMLLRNLRLDAVNINNGTLVLIRKNGSRVEIANLTLEMQDFALDSPSRLAMQADITLQEPQLAGHMALEGRLTLGNTIRFEKMQLRYDPKQGWGALSASPAPVELRVDGEYSVALGKLVLQSLKLAQGENTLDCAATIMTEPLNVSGTMQAVLQVVELGAAFGVPMPLPTQSRLEFTTRLDYSPEQLSLNEIQAALTRPNVEKTTLTGNVQLQMPQKPIWGAQANLAVGRLTLDDWLPAKKTEAQSIANLAPANPPSAPASDRAFPEPKWDTLPALDLRLNCEALSYAGLQAEKIELRLAGGRGDYSLVPARLNFSGGSVDIQGRMNRPRTPHGPSFALSGSVRTVQLEPVLHMLAGERIRGTLNSDFSLNATGMSQNALLASLNGKGFVRVDAIDLYKFNIFPANDPLGKTAMGGVTRFQRLNVPFSIKNGLANLNDTTLQGEGLSAEGTGWVHLSKRTLDYQAVISQPRLKLTMPVTVWGSLDHPKYRVGVASLIEQLGNLGKKNKEEKKDLGSELRKLGDGLKGLFGK